MEVERETCASFDQEELLFAVGPFARAQGLLHKEGFGGVLLIAPCKDVHTVGIRQPIDIAFVDARGLVLEAYRSVGPFKRLKCSGAACVMERFSRCTTPWPTAGERIVLSSLAPMAAASAEKNP